MLFINHGDAVVIFQSVSLLSNWMTQYKNETMSKAPECSAEGLWDKVLYSVSHCGDIFSVWECSLRVARGCWCCWQWPRRWPWASPPVSERWTIGSLSVNNRREQSKQKVFSSFSHSSLPIGAAPCYHFSKERTRFYWEPTPSFQIWSSLYHNTPLLEKRRVLSEEVSSVPALQQRICEACSKRGWARGQLLLTGCVQSPGLLGQLGRRGVRICCPVCMLSPAQPMFLNVQNTCRHELSSALLNRETLKAPAFFQLCPNSSKVGYKRPVGVSANPNLPYPKKLGHINSLCCPTWLGPGGAMYTKGESSKKSVWLTLSGGDGKQIVSLSEICAGAATRVRVQIWAPIALPWDANPSLAPMQPSQWFDFCSRSMTMRIYFFKSFLWGWRYSFDLKTQHIYMEYMYCT